jgi:hypothetical protein
MSFGGRGNIKVGKKKREMLKKKEGRHKINRKLKLKG